MEAEISGRLGPALVGSTARGIYGARSVPDRIIHKQIIKSDRGFALRMECTRICLIAREFLMRLFI